MWSQAELAAERALESFLALMIAAPRCWTVVMNSPLSLLKRRVTHQFRSPSKIETDTNILLTLAFLTYHASSAISSRTGFSPLEVFTVAWLTSGYWVDEWLPQIITFFTSLTWTLSLSEIWPRALLWSRRVKQVTFLSGIDGANSFKIRALVFAGLATTRTCRAVIGNQQMETAKKHNRADLASLKTYKIIDI